MTRKHQKSMLLTNYQYRATMRDVGARDDHQQLPSGARRNQDSPMQDTQGKPTPQQHTFQRLALALLAQAESELAARAPTRRQRRSSAQSARKQAS